MVLQSIQSLFQTRASNDVLNFNTNLLSADGIQTFYHVNVDVEHASSKAFLPQLEYRSMCQKDELELAGTNFLTRKKEPNLKSESRRRNDVFQQWYDLQRKRKSVKNSKSYRDLVQQMQSKNIEKSIQTLLPSSDREEANEGPHLVMKLTKSQKTLEKEIQLLSDLIQRNIIYAMQVLDYPIASKAVDKLVEQESVGFSVALSFIINTATRNITTDVLTGKLMLSQENTSTLRQKFYRLTSVIESLRRTRLKLFTKFDCKMNEALDTIIEAHSTGGIALIDDNQVSLSLGLENENYTTHSNVFSIPTTTTRLKFEQQEDHHLNEIGGDNSNNSFEGLFWSNYCSILRSLDKNSKVGSRRHDDLSSSSSSDPSHHHHPHQGPLGEMEIGWEAWNKDEIQCRISSHKMFYLSTLTNSMYLNILIEMISLVTDHFTRANSLLQTSLGEFKRSKALIKSLSKNITSSNLNSTEVKEVLKIIRVAVATSVTILKSIEKTTRISRFFISEAIQNLRIALKQNVQDNKNSPVKMRVEFTYKPNYTILNFPIRCGPGIWAMLDKLETSSPYLNKGIKDSPLDLDDTRCEDKDVSLIINTVSSAKVSEGEEAQLELEQELMVKSILRKQKTEATTLEGVQLEQGAIQSQSRIIAIPPGIKINSSTPHLKSVPPPSPLRLSSIMDESKTDFCKEFERLSNLISDRIEIAYNILCEPNTAVWEDEGKVPFVLGLCSILAKVLIETQPYRDIQPRYKTLINSSLTNLINSTNFGNEKKDFVRDIARGLTSVDEHLEKLSSLLLLKPNAQIQTKNSTNSASFCSNESFTGRLSSGHSLLLSEIMTMDSKSTEKESKSTTRATATIMWQIQWSTLIDGVLVKHLDTARQTNYANINLKTKCQIVGSLLKFADNAFSFTGLNLKAAEADLKMTNQSLKKLHKKVETFIKRNGLTIQDKLYFEQLFVKLAESHAHAVAFLGKLNSSMSQAASLLFVVNEYLRAEFNLYESLLSEAMTGRSKVATLDIIDYKIKQAEEYINSLFLFPIYVKIPIKLIPSQVCS